MKHFALKLISESAKVFPSSTSRHFEVGTALFASRVMDDDLSIVTEVVVVGSLSSCHNRCLFIGKILG